MSRSDQPRLAPIPRADFSDEMEEAIRILKSRRTAQSATPPVAPIPQTRGMNVMGSFAHHPQLAQGYYAFNGYILHASEISGRERELLILRVAALHDSHYEWVQHVYLAREAGLTDEEILRIVDGPDAEGWDEGDRLILAAADELDATSDLSEPTYQALAERYSTRQIIDIVFTVGAYQTLQMFFRVFDTQLDDGTDFTIPLLPTIDPAQQSSPAAS